MYICIYIPIPIAEGGATANRGAAPAGVRWRRNILISTLLYSTLLYSTLLDSTLLYSTLLYSTLL